MSAPQNCPICGIPSKLKCGGCKNVVYCGKDHQKQHWRKEHKGQCKCFEVSTDETLGRYLKTTRDIKKGEVILRESPTLIGPKLNSFPVCLGCHNVLQLPNGQKNFYKCSQCLWPLCGASCEKAKYHMAECEIMSKRKFNCQINYNGTNKKESAYCVITPLRCLLAKLNDPETFAKISVLEDHLEQRINTPLYGILKANVVTFIRTVLGLDEFDENEILRLAAILDTNAFEIRPPNKSIKLRGLFLQSAMMSHNCIPNSRHVFDENMNIVFIATVDIPKGSAISVSYTQPLKSTLLRREHLLQSKCFECCCSRCSDETELDTYTGAIICSKCQIGKILSTEPLNNAADWKCQICSHIIKAKQIISGNNTISKEIEQINKSSPRGFEEFLLKYRDTLHDKNTHVLQVKYALVQLYGNVNGFRFHELTDAAVKRKIDLCMELLEIADLFDPGWSRFRGMLLLDLQEITAVQTKREFNSELLTKEAAQAKLMQSMAILQEAVQILSLEPEMESLLRQRVSNLTKEIEID